MVVTVMPKTMTMVVVVRMVVGMVMTVIMSMVVIVVVVRSRHLRIKDPVATLESIVRAAV